MALSLTHGLPGQFIQEFGQYFTQENLNRFDGLYEILFDAIREEDLIRTDGGVNLTTQSERMNFNRTTLRMKNLTLSTVMQLTNRDSTNRNKTYHKIVKYFQESNMLGDLELREPR